MSTIDKLKQAQMQRSGEHEKGTVPEADYARDFYSHALNKSTPASRNKVNLLISLILFILIVVNLGFTFKLFLMIKDNNSKENNSQEKLTLVGKVVTDHANKINSISSGLGQLEKQANNQAVTNEKLVKSNNALFNRISSLELKLEQLSKQN